MISSTDFLVTGGPVILMNFKLGFVSLIIKTALSITYYIKSMIVLGDDLSDELLILSARDLAGESLNLRNKVVIAFILNSP